MRFLLTAAALLLALLPAAALAGPREIAAIEAVLADGPIDPAILSAEFSEILPADQLDAVLKDIKALVGPVVSVTEQGGTTYLVQTATHEFSVDIMLDDEGLITGLFLGPAAPLNATVESLLEEIAKQAPKVSYLVTKNGEVLHAGNTEAALSVASAFKLGVLKVLKDEIDAGQRKWSDVAELTAADLAMPSGTLQTWPVGSPLTLHTLAAMMISVSDNTATDVLIRVLGRERVEAALGIAPVITTRQLFVLKGYDDIRNRYLAATDLEAKRAVLAEADLTPLPDVMDIMEPYVEGVGWFVPVTTLCRLMEEVGDLDVTKISAGLATPTQWKSVGFKGGSELGVLSLVTGLTDASGDRYCVAVVWNAPQVLEETPMNGVYAGLLTILSRTN